MNLRLKDLIEVAESRLPAAEQSRLADLIEAFVATHEGATDFSPEDLEDLARLDGAAFDPADPADVAALFGRRG